MLPFEFIHSRHLTSILQRFSFFISFTNAHEWNKHQVRIPYRRRKLFELLACHFPMAPHLMFSIILVEMENIALLFSKKKNIILLRLPVDQQQKELFLEMSLIDFKKNRYVGLRFEFWWVHNEKFMMEGNSWENFVQIYKVALILNKALSLQSRWNLNAWNFMKIEQNRPKSTLFAVFKNLYYEVHPFFSPKEVEYFQNIAISYLCFRIHQKWPIFKGTSLPHAHR